MAIDQEQRNDGRVAFPSERLIVGDRCALELRSDKFENKDDVVKPMVQNVDVL